jgi:hypothetical protein
MQLENMGRLLPCPEQELTSHQIVRGYTEEDKINLDANALRLTSEQMFQG